MIRFDFNIPTHFFNTFLRTLPFVIVGFLVAFSIFRLYRGLWAYFSLDDILHTAEAVVLGTAINAASIYFYQGYTFSDFPRSAFLSTILFLLSWETGWRFLIRWLKKRQNIPEISRSAIIARTIVIGNSEQVDILLRRRHFLVSSIGQIVGLVTNDQKEQNLTMHGLKITGPIEQIGRIAVEQEADTLLILPPYTGPQAIKTILDGCSEAEVIPDFRVIPSIDDIASGQLDVSTIRSVAIEDLLNRESAVFDRKIIKNYLCGKMVMITGAGGSIGSEIARQVAAQGVDTIILFEMSEFGLYSIERELSTSYANLKIIAYTGDVRRVSDISDAITRVSQVDVIYHAAAYKHVPLMEKNISSCFHNNIIGSNNMAEAARKHGVERMVLISTDKAVRPTSIMGASKRLAERTVLQQPKGRTSYVAVRFGNVLGSSGSVIPLFKKQIASGGPVTVTTEDTRRYFMTIPEAVELVLMAGIVGEDRHVMVLEMGEPVKIATLARRLIELSGFIPDKDIAIEYIGLRPGEKEYEELITADEDVVETETDKIWCLQNSSEFDEPIDIESIQRLADAKDHAGLRELIAKWVPESYFATDDLPVQEKFVSTSLN